MAYNKPLKALASLAGTLTHGLRHFVPYYSLRVIAPAWGVSPHSLIHSKIKDRGSVNGGIITRFSVPPPLVILVSKAIN